MKILNFYHIGLTIPENAKYIGRYNRKYNLPESIFKNPYVIKDPKDRGTSIPKYEKHLWLMLMEEKITKQQILELEGYDLVCFCKQPHKEVACHGDIVKKAFLYVKNHEKLFDEKLRLYKEWKAKKLDKNS